MTKRLGAEVIVGRMMSNLLPRDSIWVTIAQVEGHEMMIVSNQLQLVKLAKLLRDTADDIDRNSLEVNVNVHNLGELS